MITEIFANADMEKRVSHEKCIKKVVDSHQYEYLLKNLDSCVNKGRVQ